MSAGVDAAPVPPAIDLTGRVALVAGGSRGLGEAMVRAFAAAGADVVIVGRNPGPCEELAAEIRSSTGRRALPVACHVGDWEALSALVETTYAEFGRVDALVNNAGLSPTYPSLEDVGRELFDKVLSVNLAAPFRLTTLVAPRMVEAGSGSVINVSSAGSVRVRAGALPYAAAKAGLNALTEGFAQAYGPAVRVNTILAGPFDTAMATGWDEVVHRRIAGYPLGRMGQPVEAAGAALFLASDLSSFTTGATLAVDGGMVVS